MQTLHTVLRKASNAQRRILKWGYQRLRPHATTRPVFIMGCARSGSSMTMHIFDRAYDAAIYQQRDHRAFCNGVLREADVVRTLLANSRAAVAVFKPMHENQYARRFLTAFPELRIIWLLRGYGDSVNSSVHKWSQMRQNLQAIAQGQRDVGWWGERLSEHNLALVRQYYRPEMTNESAYALFWYLRHSFYFDLNLDQHPHVRVFRYENLVTHPAQQFGEVFKFCGCPFSSEYTRMVHVHSINRHPHPEIDPEIEAHCQEITYRFEQLESVAPNLERIDSE